MMMVPVVTELLTVAPGLMRGIGSESAGNYDAKIELSLEAIFVPDQVDQNDASVVLEAPVPVNQQQQHDQTESTDPVDQLTASMPTLHIRPVKPAKAARQTWAQMIDTSVPLSDEQFTYHVPEMAKSFPFELDIFQKYAVYHLERGESVFVAAHTSAGHTVVAEYAIALAHKHMTRHAYILLF
jgi:antiviral helicase SKI2